MQIRYSKPNRIEVSGTVQELALINRDILNLIGSNSSSFVVEVETDFDPSPYDSTLSRMIVSQTEGPVRVSVVADTQLQVEGSAQNLETFASFFDFPEDSESGRHSHFEYYEGNECVAADSEPIVISVS